MRNKRSRVIILPYAWMAPSLPYLAQVWSMSGQVWPNSADIGTNIVEIGTKLSCLAQSCPIPGPAKSIPGKL